MDCIWIGACGARQATSAARWRLACDEPLAPPAPRPASLDQTTPESARSDLRVRGAMVDVVHGVWVVMFMRATYLTVRSCCRPCRTLLVLFLIFLTLSLTLR